MFEILAWLFTHVLIAQFPSRAKVGKNFSADIWLIEIINTGEEYHKFSIVISTGSLLVSYSKLTIVMYIYKTKSFIRITM